jgi:glycosyltransferase involved in cell wall biosynthesis
MMPPDLSDIVVAIPAKNETELLPRCLKAIAGQTGVVMSDVTVVASCNNCTDDTAGRARTLAAVMPFTLHVEEIVLPANIAHAGGARRHAMDAAAARCKPDGVILTTDADGVPDPNWIASFHEAFQTGVAAVAGRVSTDWEELQRFPADVLDIGAREWDYQGQSAALEALCDPQPHDPWPRHNQTCGANAAIAKPWYEKIGGLPVLRTGEDGAMFSEVWGLDGRVRHDMRPHVTVSARLVGRAQGGMADALSSRHGDQYLCDDLLEPADDLMRRASWRHAAREAFNASRLREWALAAGADPDCAEAAAEKPHFGQAWQTLEARWPCLAKRRITARGLDLELARINRLLTDIRRPDARRKAACS